MASFDLINAVGRAYQTTWDERRYLMRMALIPLLVKYICFVIASVYVGFDNVLRLSLVMIPSYFVEGWLLAHWARTIVLGHRWPFRPSGNDAKDLASMNERGRGVLGGMVAFVLINLLMAGYFAFFVSYIPLDLNPENADPKVAMIGMVMMVSSLLLFRFVWLYIPLAINFPLKNFVKKLAPLSFTFWMILLWLVCFIPSVFILQLIGGLFAGAVGAETAAPPAIQGLMIFIRVVLDMIKNLLCTAGLAYAFIEIFKWKAPKP